MENRTEGFQTGVRSISVMRKIVSKDGLKELAQEQVLDYVLGMLRSEESETEVDGKEFHACWCAPTEGESNAQKWSPIRGTYYDYYKQPAKNYLFDGSQFTDYCSYIADRLFDAGVSICRCSQKAGYLNDLGGHELQQNLVPTTMLVNEMLTRGLHRYIAVKNVA